MKNYIVRIYRQEKGKPEKIMGIVEKVGEQGRKAFTHLDELWEIFNASINDSMQDKKQKGAQRLKEVKKGENRR